MTRLNRPEAILLAVALLGTSLTTHAESGDAGLAREPTNSIAAQETLPFPMPPMGGKVGPTTQESVHKWRAQARHLPADAPNILIVMLDDAGFGQPSTFGGVIETPILSRFEGKLKRLHFKNLQAEQPAFKRSPDDD